MSDSFRAKSQNCILVKDDVGRAKASVYDLPHAGHAFGRSEQPDLEGAREVTMHWAAHVPRPKPSGNSQDFMKINKHAAIAHCKTATDLKQFREGNDFKLVPSGSQGALPKVIPSDVIPSFAYGRKSRPSTPIASVVGGHYAAEQEEALELSYQAHYERQEMESKQIVRMTGASKARISLARSSRVEAQRRIDEGPKEPFKLSKFKKVKSRMNNSNSMPILAPDPMDVSM